MNATYSFPRYLAAKNTVDDRALNRHVWETLDQALHVAGAEIPLRVLEVGAGIGTMLERMVDWRLLGSADYTAIDADPANIAAAHQRLHEWARAQSFQVSSFPTGLRMERQSQRLRVELEAVDVFDLIAREAGQCTWDLLVAHAFLDLFDVPNTLPGLLKLLRPGGLFYFTLNFDGATLLEPVVDPILDEHIQALYHRTMDERRVGGQPSGDSRTGRHLFANLKHAGAQILDAGASDWVIFPGPSGYPADEAYFLSFILYTIETALTGHPELDPERFAAWIDERRAQLRRGELVFIAHQLDFVGIKP